MTEAEIKDKISRGLCEAEITTARFAHGRNVLTPPRKPSALKRYIGKFGDPIVKILLVAACLSLALNFFDGEYAETIGIFCAIFLATGISFYFENDAAKRFDALNRMGDSALVKVVRRGKVTEIPRSEVVRGEIVLLSQGDEVPADGNILESESMVVDESSLTGEPPVHKSAEADAAHETAYPANRLMRSTMVVEGYGTMEVTETGDDTEIGRLHREATTFVPENTPLNKQLKRLASLISRAAFIIAFAAFLILTVKGLLGIDYSQPRFWIEIAKTLLSNFMMAVTLIVMAVPEGLPMAVSLSLALNMRRMLSTGTLVRRMHAGETMGAVTVICTDKTGTLTLGDMRVADIKYKGEAADFCRQVACNTTACLDEDSPNGYIGTPTEGAMLRWIETKGQDYQKLRNEVTIVHRIPFSSELKYMATLIATADGQRTVYVKGAPEVIMGMCSMNAEERASVTTLLEAAQSRAMRTLAFASLSVPATEDDLPGVIARGGLRFTGLAAISDPVRHDVPEAVQKCRRAGIKVKIVTGDNAVTAREVARKIGIWTDKDTEENIITGEEFAALSDEEALHRIAKLKIMARARPMDKQRLVLLLQKMGEVVAVTGDGTNDAPALNFANVGLAMGSGTAVAREAGDITLLDDSFATIVTAVKWGRSLYKNIQRFIIFQLTVNVTAMLTVLIGTLFGTTLPLTVPQMLWINLIMDTFAALALASLPPSERVMYKRPRRSTDFIITRPMMKNILYTSLVFTAILVIALAIVEHQISLRSHDYVYVMKNLTMFFNIFVFLQFWNLLNVRAFDSGNFAFHKFFQCKGLLLVLLIILAGQILIVEACGPVFRTFHLNFSVWLEIILGTMPVFLIPEIVRAVRRRARIRHPKGMISK